MGACIGLYFILRNKSQKTKYWTLFGVLAFNFVLHFLKLAFPVYRAQAFPAVFRKCTFENICAVSTLIFPFIYLSKSKVGKDYMFYLGVISGVGATFAPMPIQGLAFYELETIRFYICHGGIWAVPLLMVVFGLHKLDYHRNWKSIAIYFGVLALIIVNELVLIRLGWVKTDNLEDLFSAEDRDLGYAMGPPAAMEGVVKYILWLTPKAWKDPYVPILWELFPVIIIGGLITILLSLYWEHAHIKADFIKAKNAVVSFFKSRKSEKKKTEAEPVESDKKDDCAVAEEDEDEEPLKSNE